ncbi:MAG: CDP-glycerol glycerophosphotransferase family protein [Mogibacterium sp.]|nr:CDP-glycerol glycerophosphotransferase family protein [Mogibacterium sp.]
MLKRIASGIKRRIDPTDKGRVKRLMNHPPAVKPDSIVFVSSADYTGNPKALFLYMIEHGYNEKYKITWLFEHKENMFDFGLPNVDTALIWNKHGERTPAAQKAIMSARYIFYSHNVNWARKYGEDQTFVNLWHGCGYKDNVKTDKKKIYYDYVIVTGHKYIEVFKEHLKDPDGNIVPLGYPRNEFFTSNRSSAAKELEELKAKASATKAVIWMPTYRKSVLSRLDSDTNMGDTGLPVLYEEKDLREFDEHCKKRGVLLVLKQHSLQSNYSVSLDPYSNIVFMDEQYLKDKDIELYELMGRTDALLTDYSSTAIDYILLDKPIGYTVDDFDEYQEARGWCLDNVKEYMAGHHIANMEELKQFIDDVSDGLDPHKEWRNRIRPELQTYEDGFSKRILDYFGI